MLLKHLLTLGLGIGIALSSVPAHARGMYYAEFQRQYPNSKITKRLHCSICHERTGSASYPEHTWNNLNPYGRDFQNYNLNLKAIENLDSDNDGISNIEEINRACHPGSDTIPWRVLGMEIGC